MLFFIWCAIWIICADSPIEVVFPLTAIAIRAAYHHNLRIVTFPMVFVGIAMFVFQTAAGKDAWLAVTLALQVMAFAALMLHLFANFRGFNTETFPRRAAQIQQLWPRSFRIVSERARDGFESYRLRSFGKPALERVRLLVGGLASVFQELLVVTNQLELLMEARGGYPHPKYFQSSRPPVYSVVVGDGLLFALACVFAVFGPAMAIPAEIFGVFSQLSSYRGTSL